MKLMFYGNLRLKSSSLKSNELHEEGGDQVTCHQWEQHYAQSAACSQATVTVNLSSQSRPNELLEHLEWVETEGESAYWRRQEGGVVGFLPGVSYFVGFCPGIC
jgi:hypothetical protein